MFESAVNSEMEGAPAGKANGRAARALLKSAAASLATATVAALVAAGPAPRALADPPGAPVANEVYGGCTYDPAELADVLQSSHAGQFQDGAIVADYLIVLRTDTQNNGQELKHGNNQPAEYTGVVICVADPGKSASVSAEGVPIPNAEDQPGAISVDILATQGVSVLQYQVNEGARNEDIENRVCPSTDTGIDCVLVQDQ